jgi:hypothetical protein
MPLSFSGSVRLTAPKEFVTEIQEPAKRALKLGRFLRQRIDRRTECCEATGIDRRPLQSDCLEGISGRMKAQTRLTR